ncbi:M16 family metallopeptidase [Asticcacaulis tiandongensis]|uniref:M16 family metallopeptidase n=1 Tax=Asticcacaulis tiandongensis TaxID=2565365 RepID=UPI001FE68A28|nr:M16 family metallopeptidase [Asticcacaulis tiandongensis]
MFSRKLFVCTLISFAMASTALTPVSAYSAPPAKSTLVAAPKGGIEFPHDHSDIAPDPATRFGRLPNGFTYIIYPNKTPPGVVSVRLRVAAGSLQESDQQLGLAHFVEHMAFNGSKNVPEGEMVKILERHGLQFGPDTNAYTSFGETVYMLDLPKNDAEIVDTALFLMRETAGNLNMDIAAIDKERGVVLGEERVRDTPPLRAYVDFIKTAFPNQRLSKRLPIGSVDTIRTAPAQAFVDYYNDFYRPELTTLIVAGDINPDEIEAKIKDRFTDLEARSDRPLQDTDFGPYTPLPLTAHSYTEAGLRKSIQINWFKPFDDRYETQSVLEETLLDNLTLSILNQRLERLATSDTAEFISAGAGQSGLPHTADSVSLAVIPKPGRDRESFEQAFTTLRQFEAFGVTDAEIERVLSNWDASYEAAAKGENTRNTGSIVSGLTGGLEDRSVYNSPSQALALYKQLRPKLTRDAVNGRAKTLFAGDGPMITHTADDLKGFDKPAMIASFNAVRSLALEAPIAVEKKAWPYTDFGQGSALVSETQLADLGVTQLSYANGVRVNIKPTDFKDNEILVSVRLGKGVRDFGTADAAPITAANWTGITDGGLGQLEAEEIRESLSGHIYGTSFNIGNDATTLSGTTTPNDFALQLQYMAAFLTDAAFRPSAFERIKGLLPDYYASLSTTPNGVFSRYGSVILHGGDKRFGMPEPSEVLALENQTLKTLVSGIFTGAPLEITIVGDITPEAVKAQLGDTFAALPPRPAPATKDMSADVRFPRDGLHQVLTHQGRDDQNLSLLVWPATDFYANIPESYATELLSAVLTLHLTEEIREKQGAAYGSTSSASLSGTFKDFGYITASATVKPDMDQTFYDSVVAIAEDLKARPISDDDLLRARKPVLDRQEVQIKTNGYWLGALSGIQSDPRRLDNIRERKQRLEQVTPAEIQAVAQKWLQSDRLLRIQVKPAEKAE